MIWFLPTIPLIVALVAFLAGRAVARGRAEGVRAHSRPEQHGFYAAIWTAMPALVVVLLALAFGGRVERLLLEADQPAAVSALDQDRKDVFYADVTRVASGNAPMQAWEAPLTGALAEQAKKAEQLDLIRMLGAVAAALAAAGLGGLFAFSTISPGLRARNHVERWVVAALLACSAVAVLTTVGIIAALLVDATRFFQSVPVLEFLTGTQWSPQTAIRADQVGSTGAFGALPLFAGTFLIMLIAMAVAAPIGLLSAIYLSEYAGSATRAVIKPVLEILAGIPTVVYGFFAALTVGPAFRQGFNWLGAQLVGGPLDGLGQYLLLVQNQMALVAGAVMGIMLIPFVSSLSDDIINAVPQSLRDGSYALGATKSETVGRVLMPAALPGIAGALLLAVSRAVGETMIVTMAAGLAARLTLNPLDTVTTVTVQIVTLLTGDQEFDSPKTLSAFGLGLTLFVATLILNVIAQRIVQTYRQQYD